MGRKNKPYSDKSAPYATMGDSPDDYLYKKGKKQKLVGSADNSPENGEEELEEAPGDFYNVDGYIYRQHEIEDDEGFIKRWHYMLTPDNEEIYIDYTPYQDMDKDEFIDFVEKFKRSSLKENDMTDELNDIRKLAGLEVVAEDCDETPGDDKNDDGDCSPFTHADENVEMVREKGDLDEGVFDWQEDWIEDLMKMGKQKLWMEYNRTLEGEDYPGRSDKLEHMAQALDRLGISVATESEVEEDFLAPPKDSEDTYDTDQGDDWERTEPELDRQTDYNAPPRDDGDDSYDMYEQGPGDDEFAHDEDAMIDIGDEDYDSGEDLSDFGGEYYGDSQYYESVEENIVEMNELRKLAGMEPVTEGWRDPEGVHWKEANLVSPDEYDDKGRRLITKADLEANGPIYGDSDEVTGSSGTSTGHGNDNWAEISIMKGFPNLKQWWKEDPKDIMSFVYWQKRQLPPDGEAWDRNWEKVKSNLAKKYGEAPMTEAEGDKCIRCRKGTMEVGDTFFGAAERCDRCGYQRQIDESAPHGSDDYDFIDFKDETGYYIVADEIGDRIIFGMNNEVGIPEQYTDKIIGLLRAQGLEKGIDYDFTSFANQSIGGEPVEEEGELQNGYNDREYVDGEDLFPRGSHQSPSDDLGPTASGYGDNAMKNRMRSKETDTVYEGMKQKYRRHRLS